MKVSYVVLHAEDDALYFLLATTVVLTSKCKFCFGDSLFKAKHLRGEYFEACCWKELFDCGLVTVVHELTEIKKKLARKLSCFWEK